MHTHAELLKAFIESIKNISLLQRIFCWKKIRMQLTDAAAAFSSITTELHLLQGNNQQLTNELSGVRKDLQLCNEQKTRLEEAVRLHSQSMLEKDTIITDLNKKLSAEIATKTSFGNQITELQQEIIRLKEQTRQGQEKLDAATKECIELRKEEDGRKAEQAKAMHAFQKWREEIQKERNDEIAERQQAEINKLHLLKQTWQEHESNVKSRVRSLCQKLTIEYADTVPFKGSPDNTIKLAEEFIVFDAKSPGSDDLNNFPTYLKDQAERAKKYARQEGVKKDVFFVVPSNTLEVLKQTVFSHSDHEVYIVSIDVLEPLLLCLQKIETYEFAKQLTPEERENICRIIGRFTHLTKRRIQIDSFFAKQFMEMVLKCDSDLPEEIKKEVAAFEKIEKLNPPTDKRNKVIDNKDLHKDMLQLEMQIQNEGIEVADLSERLNGVRLYREE